MLASLFLVLASLFLKLVSPFLEIFPKFLKGKKILEIEKILFLISHIEIKQDFL